MQIIDFLGYFNVYILNSVYSIVGIMDNKNLLVVLSLQLKFQFEVFFLVVNLICGYIKVFWDII